LKQKRFLRQFLPDEPLKTEFTSCGSLQTYQKFSICQAFLEGLTSSIASDRPSGDGIAYATKLLERSKTEALPSSVTLSKAWFDS